jgi:2,6-dihydroxypseudooxynicotine hydrolase
MLSVPEIFKRESHKLGDEIFDHWFPRFLVGGTDYNDVISLKKTYKEWDMWPVLWSSFGEKHLLLAENAEKEKNYVTAGYAYRRAAMYFHYGQFMLFDKPITKVELHRRSIDASAKALKYLPNPGEKINIPFKGKNIYAHYRFKKESEGRLVMLIPGADATKEELSTFEDIFLERGLSTLTVDGPGQGETRYEFPFRKSLYDEAMSTVLEYAKVKLNGEKIAVGGISFGGSLAPRIAALNPQVKAAFGVGGKYSYESDEWDRLSCLFHAASCWYFCVDTFEEAKQLLPERSVSDVMKNLTCPLLIVHGDMDKIADVKHAYKFIENSSSSDPNIVIIEGGNHVCNNYPYLYRPMIGDWVNKQLS